MRRHLIDVNEQNIHAAAVYRHWGFEAYERTDTDDQGNPFPILKMQLKIYSYPLHTGVID